MRPGTPGQDTGWPDAAETDPAALNGAEELDEDWLGVDPLEAGVEPPERWSGADRFGTTAREESEGLSLDQRLIEEEPDIAEPAADETEYRPAGEPAADETDYQPDPDVDYRGGDLEGVELDDWPESDAVRRGQSADEAGGSVARAMRTPDEPDER